MNPKEQTIEFGVGCFHFATEQKQKSTISGDQYVKELHETLASISNIRKVNIEADESFKDFEIEIPEDGKTIGKTWSFFPGPATQLRVKFEIFIPFRLEDKLFSYRDLNTGTENYEVQMRYDPYHFPITYVSAIESTGICYPSDCVIVVRQFLQDQFEKIDSFRFEYLGPSPFHANFFLLQADVSTEEYLVNGLSYKIIKQRQYDKIEFCYDSNSFKSIYEAKAKVFSELQDELAVFYSIVNFDQIQMIEWAELRDIVDELIDINTREGVLALMQRILGSFGWLNNAFITLAKFESSMMWSSYFMNRNYRQLLDIPRPLVLEKFIQKMLSDRVEYPTDQIRQLITMIETQRTKRVEGIVTIVAAVLGGTVGAIITLLATSG